MADESKTLFDAVVVGSGASGGWACKRLTEAGLKVALVDCGRAVNPNAETRGKGVAEARPSEALNSVFISPLN